jgi:SAM-dependent methyltransferase
MDHNANRQPVPWEGPELSVVRDPVIAFPEEAARPLGKGYSAIMQMVLSYAVEGKVSGTPTLAHSLNRFRQLPGIAQHVAALAKPPLCLIEGYSTPDNADALCAFAVECGSSFPHIETVDLYDLPHLYNVLGLKMPPMRYHVADAAHLEHLYPSGSVEVVVQDFLLNCIPAAQHEPLVREAARVLKPGGLALLSFTSHEALDVASALSTADLRSRHRLKWDDQAYDLAELQASNSTGRSLDFLMGRLLHHPATSEFIYVAKAGGRFEFFRSKEAMFALFEQCGLTSLGFDVTQGSDDHGLQCVRYRCLLTKLN